MFKENRKFGRLVGTITLILGATRVEAQPALDGYIFRTGGGSVNGYAIDATHYEVTVAPGEAITGSIAVEATNLWPGNVVAPLGGTVTWGDRATQPWLTNGWIPPGTHTFNVAVNKTAPDTPGDYHIVVAFRGEFTIQQVMSLTNWTMPGNPIWYDGNDAGFDWTPEQFQQADQRGAVLTTVVAAPAHGGPYTAWLPATAVIVHVAAGTRDCNSNGIPDDQDIANCDGSPWCGDCNDNGVPDGCDVTPQVTMFGDRLDVPVIDEPNGIAVADLSDPPDGILDMIVGRDHGGDVAVFYGQTARGFGNATTYTLSMNSSTSHVGFAVDDFDHDGRLDFATATHRFGNSVSVLYGQPGGGFDEQFTVGGGNQPAFLAKADFDGDDILDLAVTNVVPFGPPGYVSILKGAVDGTFSVIANPAVGQYPYGIAAGDLNGDQRADLVVANAYSGSISVLLGDGTGQFPDNQLYSLTPGPLPGNSSFVVVGDFNGDSALDAALTMQVLNKIVLLYGQPNGEFDPVNDRHDVPVGNDPVGIAQVDLNRDGFLDLVVANAGSNTVSVLLGDTQGLFNERRDFAVGSLPLQLVLADFDRDGWDDIAVTCLLSDSVTILYNRSAWGQSEDCDANRVPDECQPDCDHDGAPDACELYSFFSDDFGTIDPLAWTHHGTNAVNIDSTISDALFVHGAVDSSPPARVTHVMESGMGDFEVQFDIRRRAYSGSGSLWIGWVNVDDFAAVRSSYSWETHDSMGNPASGLFVQFNSGSGAGGAPHRSHLTASSDGAISAVAAFDPGPMGNNVWHTLAFGRIANEGYVELRNRETNVLVAGAAVPLADIRSYGFFHISSIDGQSNNWWIDVEIDNLTLTASGSEDCDANGIPDECQLDTDGDGHIDDCDNCPTVSNPDQADSDSDGMGDACDGCPNDLDKIAPGQCGCGEADIDTDRDGTADCNDYCANDANKIEPGICGCGVADTDTDGDGTADCNDPCPNDANKTEPGVCGCGISDAIGFVGFLPPIGGADATGGSFADPLRAFKLGSTIPVKFMASQCGNPLLNGVHTLRAVKYSSAVDSDAPIDATPTDAATTGNQFRLTDGGWHFNLSTRTGFSQGTWKLIATLSDGSTHYVWITIKK